MRRKRVVQWLALAVAVLFGVPFGCYHFVWEGRPFCHKQMSLGFENWLDEQREQNPSGEIVYPNVNGVGEESLAILHDNFYGTMDWAKDYNYVPGLQRRDPDDLVMLYFNRPTRWTWHGMPPTIFHEKQWIVVPVDFQLFRGRPTGPGELSERISADEFRTRLRRTLDYIREKKRPNWEAIVAEHEAFLKSIEETEP